MPESVFFQEIVKIVESAGRIDMGDMASHLQIPEREIKNAIQDLADRVKDAKYVCVCRGRAAGKTENRCFPDLSEPLFLFLEANEQGECWLSTGRNACRKARSALVSETSMTSSESCIAL